MDTNTDREVGAFLDRDWDSYPPRNFPERLALRYQKIFNEPVMKLRKWILSVRGEPYNYYHRVYQRVPTIDQCYVHDTICQYEADEQMKRDKKIDEAIIKHLTKRMETCLIYERAERGRCDPLVNTVKEAHLNYFIKYGDTGMNVDAKTLFMKQKHRMAWERRHGPVGSGMKQKHIRNDGTVYYE